MTELLLIFTNIVSSDLGLAIHETCMCILEIE